MDYEPISVALKFGFLAVLYLFLLWVARSGLKDLRRVSRASAPAPELEPDPLGEPMLVVESGEGLRRDEQIDVFGGVSIGRSSEADVRIDDRYASGLHARIHSRGSRYFIEDMNSTNGTLVNGADLVGEMELAPGDLVAIGDTTFRFEVSR